MRTIPHSVTRWLRFGLLALLCVAALAPMVARADTDLDVGGLAHVAYADGDQVRLRTGPGYDNDTVKMVPEGTTLDVLRGPVDAEDRSVWYKVNAGGDTGYMVSDYLASGAGSGAAETSDATASTTSDAAASTTSGGNTTVTTAVNLRSGPSLADDALLVIPSGASVTLTGDSQNGFSAVSYQGTDGWVFDGYLGDGASSASSDNSSTSSDTSSSSSGNSSASSGGTATTTDALNLRSGPSYADDVILVMPAGASVALTGDSQNGFDPVAYNGTAGWAVATYLDSGNSGNSASSTAADGNSSQASGSATGQALVNFAMPYLGYPYVAATHGPDSFDCSGFTYWVVLHVLGIDIGTGLWTQVAAGTPVDQSNLQPGDLVFFQNTFEAGLSHVGIYIGNGQFIHAENPSTGVVIGSLSDPYYAADWYGAVRLT